MYMYIKKQNNKFYLYFEKVENKNLFGIFDNLAVATSRAKKLLKIHNSNTKNIIIL